MLCMAVSCLFTACGSQKEEMVHGKDMVLEELKQKYQNVDVDQDVDFMESDMLDNYISEAQEDDSANEIRQENRFNTDVIEEMIQDFANEQNKRDEIVEKQDIIDRSDWSSRTAFPTQSEIDEYNRISTKRSPYMALFMDISADTYYTEFMVDIKSDHFPLGSYYSIGNWYIDYSSLRQQYRDVRTEYGISGYAGLQNIHTGEHIGIMSIWDVYCTDASGKTNTIRAKQIYPDNAYKSGGFTGEGVGVQCLEPYDWEESHWYRAHLKCKNSNTTGNMVLEYWMYDLETNEETLVCAYDMGFKDSSFYGSMCLFLENYIVGTAGDIRTMEIRNPKYLDKNTGIWNDVMEADMLINGSAITMDYAGSCDFGVEDGTLWIMTTGVGNDHVSGEQTHLYLK